jgi:hypothetical protein
MPSVLDELFDAEIASVPYSMTITDIDPSQNQPAVAYATGTLKFRKELVPGQVGSTALYLLDKYYRDDEFVIMSNHGIPINASWKPQWADQLILRSASNGYYFRYQIKTTPNAGASFTPEISEGKGFPGFPHKRTAVLVAKLWLGAAVLVLSLPDRKG